MGFLLLQCLVAVIWPFWGVEFAHVLVADAMTSAALLLYQMEMTICFLIHGDFFVDEQHETPYCSGSNNLHSEIMKPIMYALPFWIRFIQCLYKFLEDRQKLTVYVRIPHLINAAKYFSGILVIVFSSLKTLDLSSVGITSEQIVYFWVVSLIVKTVFCYAWDILMDWDLGQLQWKDFLLRPRRIFPKWQYYLLFIFNLAGRCSWSFALSMNTLPPVWDPLMAMLEILRRSVWFIFRIEKEYLTVLGPATTNLSSKPLLAEHEQGLSINNDRLSREAGASPSSDKFSRLP